MHIFFACVLPDFLMSWARQHKYLLQNKQLKKSCGGKHIAKPVFAESLTEEFHWISYGYV